MRTARLVATAVTVAALAEPALIGWDSSERAVASVSVVVLEPTGKGVATPVTKVVAEYS